jgi:hypothetical protein
MRLPVTSMLAIVALVTRRCFLSLIEILPLRTTELIVSAKLRQSKYVGVIVAQSPEGGQWDLGVTQKTIQRAAFHSEHESNTLKHCVSNVAKQPIAIFQGLRGENSDHLEGLAYIGTPPLKYNRGGSVVPKEDEFFLLFTCCERRIFSWRWEKCSQIGAQLLLELSTRFDRLVWKP